MDSSLTVIVLLARNRDDECSFVSLLPVRDMFVQAPMTQDSRRVRYRGAGRRTNGYLLRLIGQPSAALGVNIRVERRVEREQVLPKDPQTTRNEEKN